MTELRALTGARGIAAWFVVLYHVRASIAGLPPLWLGVFAKGYLAVDFFFLLSGFVIWLTWHERFCEGGLAAVPGFLRKRIARIWPLHLFMLGCAVLLAIVLAAHGHPDPAFPFAELPLHVLLLQNWGFTDHLSWNDPSWSISAELGAYLSFPLLVTAIDWRRCSSIALIAFLGGLLLLLHALMAGAPTLGTGISRFGLIRCLTEFAVGTTIGALWLRWHERRWIAAPALLFAVMLLACWAFGAPETLAVPASFAAILLGLALTAGMRGNPLEGWLLHYLGEISYATYLGHFLVWKALKLALADGPASPALIALYLLMVFVSSIALYHLIERPAQRWINNPRGRRATHSTTVTPPARRPILPPAPRSPRG